MLSFRSDRYVAFGRDAAANFRYDDSLWLSWVGATGGAGFLFGLATWLPFVMVRYLPSRLLLAALALLPLAHFWILIQGHAGSSVGPGGKWMQTRVAINNGSDGQVVSLRPAPTSRPDVYCLGTLSADREVCRLVHASTIR